MSFAKRRSRFLAVVGQTSKECFLRYLKSVKVGAVATTIPKRFTTVATIGVKKFLGSVFICEIHTEVENVKIKWGREG